MQRLERLLDPTLVLFKKEKRGEKMKIPIIKIGEVNRICYISEFRYCLPYAKIISFVEFEIKDIFTNEWVDCANLNGLFSNSMYEISEGAYREIIRELDKVVEKYFQEERACVKDVK